MTVYASVEQLTKVLGVPDISDNTGQDKVNFEWVRETETGDVVTIYDWKQYRPLYNFSKVDWHIGGHSLRATQIAKTEIETLLK